MNPTPVHAKMFQLFRALALVPLALVAMVSIAKKQPIVMASTTSTEQSGLFGTLLPAFKQASGIDIKVVALGTGQAIDMGRRGMPTCSLCTTRWPRRKSWPRALRSGAFL